MDTVTILDGLAFLLAIVLIVAAFVSKTIVWRPPIHNTPRKITWFGRVFMFLAGSVGVLQFGIAVLRRRGVLINPVWSDRALQTSTLILEFLFLTLVTPLLIVLIRQLIRREDPSKVNRVITVFLTAVSAYLLWNVIPDIVTKASGVLHRHPQ